MALKRGSKLRLLSLLVGLVVAAIFCALQLGGVFERYELTSLDARYRLRGPRPLGPEISVVAVDRDTLEALGWPLPRSAWAELIDIARKNGARVIGFDVLFSDPGPGGPEQDQLFAQLAARRRDVVFPSEIIFGTDGKHEPTPTGTVPPLEELAAASAGSAHFQLDNRPDGVFRRAPLLINYQGQLVPALALRLVALFKGVSLGQVAQEEGRLLIGNLAPGGIPLSRQGRTTVYVHYRTMSSGIRLASLIDILSQEAGKDAGIDREEFFKNKLVIVGQTAGSVGDHGPTPLSNSSPLVLVHANLADNLLSNRYLERATPLTNALVLTFFCLALALLVGQLRMLPGIAAALSLLVGGAAVIYWFFVGQDVWLDSVAPLTAGVFTTLAVIAYNHFIRDADERLLRKAFERYVAPGLIERILERREDLQLLGATKNITILFSDIKGYTSLSNRLDPERVLDILRRYMEVMTAVLFKHGGTVDKIMGDGIMAYFGDPLPMPDHALRAVKAALEMQREQTRLQEKWTGEGLEGLQMRIGIATGQVYVGNIGSRHHIEYTALGRAVNLAARLESAAPAGGILVSSQTYEQVKKQFEFRKIEGLVLKGYEEVTSAYLVTGEATRMLQKQHSG